MDVDRSKGQVTIRLDDAEAGLLVTALGGVVDRTPGETLDGLFSSLVVEGVLPAGRWFVEVNEDHDPDDEDSEQYLYVVD